MIGAIGHTYFVRVAFSPLASPLDTAYIRVDETGKLYRYWPAMRSEDCVLDPTLESYTDAGPSYHGDIVVARNEDWNVPAGSFTDCLHAKSGAVESTSSVYARGIGMIAYWNWSGRYELLYARVDGVRYPH
jgi:hypothetical protein